MWHRLLNTPSNNMNRITLLMYVITTMKMRPETTMVAMSPASNAGSIFGRFRGPWLPCWAELKLDGKWKLPPEPNSPASRPTMANLVHCPKRKGWNNCRLVCWKASEIVSTAEIGMSHLDTNRSSVKVNRICPQINSCTGSRRARGLDERLASSLITQRLDRI